MSAQPAPALIPQPEPPKEIPELTDAYRKVHKNYVLASGLLASWELIGITIQTKEKWGLELKSPAAVPIILFSLVIYFGYKTWIEWWQCNPERKKHLAAKWDYRIAHAIALIAMGISTVQYLLRIQIVDLVGHYRDAIGLVLSVPFVGMLIIVYLNTVPVKRRLYRAAFALAFCLLVIGRIVSARNSPGIRTAAILVIIIGIALAIPLRIRLRQLKHSQQN
ncbi:MAG TPA: hypothetical protein VI685_20060 [Candidatus Angelobacter sp.]